MIMIGKTEYNKTKETYGNLFLKKTEVLEKEYNISSKKKEFKNRKCIQNPRTRILTAHIRFLLPASPLEDPYCSYDHRDEEKYSAERSDQWTNKAVGRFIT